MNIFLPPLQGPILAFYLLNYDFDSEWPWAGIEDSYRALFGIPSIFD